MDLKFFINAIFPAHCLGCEKETDGEAVCGGCFESIRLNQTLFCGKCRLRLADNKKICHKDYPFVLGAASDYSNDLVKELIHSLKFKLIRSAADALGELLAKYISGIGVSFQNFLVIPLPLSTKRLRERGFNQSELIAEKFASRAGLTILRGALLRIKDAKPQSESIRIAERKENVRGAFALKNTEFVAGGNIILVDDVITSGATMFEAARALKAAGARKIIGLTAAMV